MVIFAVTLAAMTARYERPTQMDKRWNIKPQQDTAEAERLSKELNINPVLTQLLLQRGVNTFDEARAFFRPKLTDLHNPFLMKDMDKAVARINRAIADCEKIMIYGDYDVDGTTAVALVYSFLKRHIDPNDLEFYIPDRYNEGYGISFQGIDFAFSKGITLVIALDCGIKAVDKVKYAKSIGIDFIICDHHQPGDELPAAAACLDAKRDDCKYPDKNLSGCGVGFKLMQAFCRVNNFKESELLEHLDLLVVSIASDIVPMTGENRILAYHGLKKLNESPSVGLRSIIEVSGLSNKNITISDIVFKIGPRINAAGRIRTGSDAVSLLICNQNELETARLISRDIDQANNDRKDLDRQITREAIDMIESDEAKCNSHSTVLFNRGWHKGVIGIVASRLTETYYRPTVILTESKGLATGSARSIDGFDLYKAIESCSDLLENFGGHMYAAGLSMKLENVEKFAARFEQYVAENILPEQLTPQIEVDSEINLSTINDRFYNILRQFEPFGPCNMKPVFMTKEVYDVGTSKIIGKDQNHLKLELIERNNRETKSGVAFGMGEKFSDIHGGQRPFSVCYTIEENEFRGIKSLQLMIRDIHTQLSENQDNPN